LLFRINNCVSFTNYKYFVLFLGYSFALCLYGVITTLNYFLKFWKNELTSSGRFNIIFLFFIAVTFAISLVSLFGYHIYLVIHNRSTLESFRAPVFRFGPDKNGFNLGKYNNCVQIFGKTKWKWFIPIKTRYVFVFTFCFYLMRLISHSFFQTNFPVYFYEFTFTIYSFPVLVESMIYSKLILDQSLELNCK